MPSKEEIDFLVNDFIIDTISCFSERIRSSNVINSIVSFKYPNTYNYIIQNLDFKINKGERLIIVGINGAGKTTLVKLMTGLFDVSDLVFSMRRY